MARGRYTPDVVPAKAGTHNHRVELLERVGDPTFAKQLPVVMGPGSRFACPGRQVSLLIRFSNSRKHSRGSSRLSKARCADFSGQPDCDPRAAGGCLRNLDCAAVLALDDPERNRQSQSRAAGRAAAGGFAAMKGGEHRAAIGEWYSRPVVVDNDLDYAVVSLHPDARLPAITQRVADDVGQRAGERRTIAGH